MDGDMSKLLELQRHMESRLTALEDRMQATETLASRIPGIEARIGRVERLVLEVQVEARQAARDSLAAQKGIDEKLARLLSKMDHINRAVSEE